MKGHELQVVRVITMVLNDTVQRSTIKSQGAYISRRKGAYGCGRGIFGINDIKRSGKFLGHVKGAIIRKSQTDRMHFHVYAIRGKMTNKGCTPIRCVHPKKLRDIIVCSKKIPANRVKIKPLYIVRFFVCLANGDCFSGIQVYTIQTPIGVRYAIGRYAVTGSNR